MKRIILCLASLVAITTGANAAEICPLGESMRGSYQTALTKEYQAMQTLNRAQSDLGVAAADTLYWVNVWIQHMSSCQLCINNQSCQYNQNLFVLIQQKQARERECQEAVDLAEIIVDYWSSQADFWFNQLQAHAALCSICGGP